MHRFRETIVAAILTLESDLDQHEPHQMAANQLALKDEVQALKEEVQALKEEVQALKGTLGTCRNELSIAQSTQERTALQLADECKHLAEERSKLAEERKNTQWEREHNRRLQDELDGKKQQETVLQQLNQDLLLRAKTAEASISNIDGNRQDNEKRIVALELQLGQSRIEVGVERDHVRQLQETLELCKQEHKEREACTQEDLICRKRKCKEQESKLQQWKDESQASILSHDRQCQKLEIQNKQLLLRVSEAEASLADIANSRQEGSCRQCSEQSKMNEVLQVQLEKSTHSQLDENAKHGKEIERMQDERHRLESERNRIESERKRLESESERLRGSLQHAEAVYRQCQEERKSDKQKYKDQKISLKQLTQDLKQLKEDSLLRCSEQSAKDGALNIPLAVGSVGTYSLRQDEICGQCSELKSELETSRNALLQETMEHKNNLQQWKDKAQAHTQAHTLANDRKSLKCQTLKTRIEELTANFAGTDLKYQVLMAANNTLKQRALDAEESLTQANVAHQVSLEENKRLTNVNANINATLETSKDRAITAKKEWNESFSVLRESLADARSKLSSSEQQQQKLLDKITPTTERKTQLEGQNQILIERLEESQEQLEESQAKNDTLEKRERARTSSSSAVGRNGEKQLRNIIDNYFGHMGELEDVSQRGGIGDFIFDMSMNGVKVRILIESKTKMANAKEPTPVPKGDIEKFMKDCCKPSNNISAGFLCSRRPLGQESDFTLKPRSVWLDNVPLEINAAAETKIVRAFVSAIVQGAIWEKSQSKHGQNETREVIKDMAMHIRCMDHSLQNPLDLLNSLRSSSLQKKGDLAHRLQNMTTINGTEAASMLCETPTKKQKRKTDEPALARKQKKTANEPGVGQVVLTEARLKSLGIVPTEKPLSTFC